VRVVAIVLAKGFGGSGPALEPLGRLGPFLGETLRCDRPSSAAAARDGLASRVVPASAFQEGSELDDGRYVLEHRLGTGGMATVWLALDTRLHRRVAIKVPSEALSVNETYRLRFQREARTAAAVSHPNLVPVYDYGCEGEHPYLVSEFIDGDSLALLRERGEPPATEALARALLSALGLIHAAGIVHRDVKPANVLVEGGGRIMLTDFGIAQSEEHTALTATGMVIGTQTYIAPEVKRGERAGPRADLYACGVVLREQLSPQDRDSLHRLVLRLTAQRPSARPATAQEALESIERESAVVTATAPVDDATQPTEEAPRPALSFPRPPLPLPSPGAPRGPERVFERGERRPFEPPPPVPVRSSRLSRALVIGLLAAVALAAVIAAIALSGGGDESGGGGRAVADATSTGSEKAKDKKDAKGEGGSTAAPAPAETTPTTAPVEPEPPTTASTPDPVTASQLNDEGYALLQAGDPQGALPKLEQSVALFPADSTEITHAYALFNYAQALRLTGDPAAAIPLLEKRLSFSDDQRDTVEAELELARSQAAGG